jgi:hypothetical protein
LKTGREPCARAHPRDYVAEVDADPELDPLVRRDSGVGLGHSPLDLNSATDGGNHAGELRQQAVAGVLYDTAPVLLDLRIDQLPRPAPDTFRFNLLYGARRFVRLFFTRLG